MEEKIISFFRFEDLRVYEKAVEYGKWVMQHLKEPSTNSERMLVESFVRSVLDIPLNIAEGGSRSRSQFESHLKISKTAVRECLTFTTLSYRMGLLNDEENEYSRGILMELTRMLGALIISLQRAERRDPVSRSSTEEMGNIVDDDFDTDFMEKDIQ